MRDADIVGPVGSAWKVPMGRLTEYVLAHEGDIHPASRGDRFVASWEDVWYIRHLAIEDLENLRAEWAAVVLRDLRGTSLERFYVEAEWDLTVFNCDPAYGRPPINGEALFEWDQSVPPPIMYQFHGLTDDQVLRMGGDAKQPVTFAQLLVEAICVGATRPADETWSHRLSKLVNGIREAGLCGEPPARPLEVAARTGLLIELEDGASVTMAREVPEERTN